MKKDSNNFSTKDELISNFNKEQLEVYNYYKSKFVYNEVDLYPILKQDKEILFLEKGCSILSTILKVEVAFTLIIATALIFFNGRVI